MSFTVRSLLAKVRPFRKDLSEDECNYAIKETVRKVCRQTGYAQSTFQVSTTALSPTVDIKSALASLGTPYRVHLVRLLDTNLNAYKMLYEYNRTVIDSREAYRNYATGWPSGWAYNGNGICEIYPTPDKIYTLEVTASYVPLDDVETIPLPAEAEEAIVAGSLSMLLMLPGTNQNVNLAKDREVLFNREIDFLKANALLGQSGRAKASGRNLATRAIRMWDNRWQ